MGTYIRKTSRNLSRTSVILRGLRYTTAEVLIGPQKVQGIVIKQQNQGYRRD
jgi:hypothetical protein